MDFHYNGFFSPNPLVYLDPVKTNVRDVDFGGFTYKEFLLWLTKLTNGACDNVYYCVRKESLCEGIRRIDSDADYWEFVETVYSLESDSLESKLDVYIDHRNEPILDWADKEFLADGKGYESDYMDEEDDKDSEVSMTMEYEHEWDDEEEHTFDKTVGDPFLDKLSGHISDDDEEEANNGKLKDVVFPVHNENQEWEQMVPVLGMKFSNPLELKLCITNYAVKNGYDLWYEKSDHERLLVKCCKGKTNKQGKGCPFRLWATWMSSEKSFQIKSLNGMHNCARVFKFGSIVTYKWIAKHFMNHILQKPKMSIRKLKAKVSKKFNLIASVGQCRNARKYAFQEIEGTLKEHYAKTWSYGEEIRRTNPGSTVKMDVDVMPDGTTYFSKFYVCFKGLKDGWIEGCRRVIGLDGCFLKGICRGQLLSAIGRDANNHIYPIAWAVVSVESKETWKWFIDLLIQDLGMGVGHGLTLISDQHKGLLEAVKERVPAAEHRQCARHICANFLKRFKGQVFRKLFWYAAAATTPAKFEQHMNEIKKLEPLAYDHLMERDPKTWSKAFFQTDRACDAYENGISESFNSVIEVARKRPLITMLEEIRIYVMERLYRQKIKGQSWDLTICPTIRLKLSKLKDLQRFWKVIPSGYQQYEVRLGYDAYVVDIGSRTCACRTWQLTGYPCVHGYACIASLNRDVEEYVSPWFTTSMYLNCYRYTINPLNGSDMWPHVDYINPLPPKRRRLPGRPSTKRKRDQIERENQGKKHSITKRGSVMKCSICRESGHNKTTCPQKPIGESSNASSKKKKSKKADKVKVVLAHEVDIDSESEVEIEPESDVDSFDIEFEDDVQPEVEDGVEPEVQDGVQHEVQDEVQAEVEPENHPEVHDANQVEVHLAVQAEVEPEVQVQVEDANQIVVQDQVEIPAFQVVVGKRARKPSERITKLKIRKMWEGKQGSSDDNPISTVITIPLQCNHNSITLFEQFNSSD
uniref:SWIM-type domain-containing protein n=1 Tax=Lactuca sativa TaxID=4236 RepID=A0A9R1WVC6_LACSA|nr:hypothetical protein LSAT_V11C900463080 [Lactuca sativa]